MKHCIECGAQLSDDAQFCINCGADVEPPATDNAPDQAEGIENNVPEENIDYVPDQYEAHSVPQQPIPQKPPMYSQQPAMYPQQPIQQQPEAPQPGMYQQTAPQQPMPQQPGPYQQAAPQQPMQQPGMYQQPMPQQQQYMPQQPVYPQPEQNRGSSNKTLIYVLIPLITIGAVVAILFATGVFSGKKDAPKSDQQEVSAQVQPSEQDQPSEEEIQPTVQSGLGSQNVTLGGITFALPEDYEVQDRTTLKDSEACIIVPKGASDRANRLILRIYPSMLEGVDGITNEEIGDMLNDIVDNNAGVLANTEKTGFKLDRAYKIHYDDNADGSYFPHCYTYLNWTDRNGKHSRSYTEATLVKRIVTSCSAIATDEGELNAFTDIYSEVVQAANK